MEPASVISSAYNVSKLIGNVSLESASSAKNSERNSIPSKVKKMLSSPKSVHKSKSNRYFGISLDVITLRDGADVPAIVIKMCNYLKTHGINQEGLFRVNGNMKVVERLKNTIEKDGDVNLGEVIDVPAVASLLKLFLRELSEPVIPDDMLPLFIKIQDQYGNDKVKALDKIKELIRKLPKVHKSLLHFLCEFMLCISANASKNKMTPLALAIVFGPNLFRCRDGIDGLREQAYVNAILLFLLQEFEQLFSDTGGTELESFPEKPITAKHRQKDNECKPKRPPPPIVSSEDENDICTYFTVQFESNNLSRKQSSSILCKEKKVCSQDSKLVDSNAPRAYSSPLNKQFVDSTINETVREHLFGSAMGHCPINVNIDFDVKDGQQMAGQTAVTFCSVENLLAKCDMVGNNEMLPSSKPMHQCTGSVGKNLSGSKREDVAISRSANESHKNLGEEIISTSDIDKIDSRSNRFFYGDKSEESMPFSESYEPTLTLFKGDDSVKDVNSEASQSMEFDIDLKSLEVDIGHSSPRESNNKLSDNHPKTVVPPLELFRIHQDDMETQLSPRGRLGGHGNFDAPVRSPRSEPSTPNRINGFDRRYEFWQEKRQDTVPTVEMSPLDLKKRINALKKIVSNFESNFEDLNDRKPKANEKVHIQKYLAELGRAKKQLRELMSDYKGNSDRINVVTKVPSDPSFCDNFVALNVNSIPSKEQTLASILKKLQERRLQLGRPEEIQAMSWEQLLTEKLAVQKALLHYEGLHGRPNSKQDKSLMRPIYDRYRRIKRLIATDTANSPSKIARHDSPRSALYQTVSPQKICDETMSILEQGLNLDSEPFSAMVDVFNVTNQVSYKAAQSENQSLDCEENNIAEESVLHDASLPELLEQQRDSKRSKKRLGKLLKEYEDQFFEKCGRRVGKNDRLPLEQEYREYKLIKSKLRLIEALVAKKQSNMTI